MDEPKFEICMNSCGKICVTFDSLNDIFTKEEYDPSYIGPGEHDDVRLEFAQLRYQLCRDANEYIYRNIES